jgi:hypothetical protein
VSWGRDPFNPLEAELLAAEMRWPAVAALLEMGVPRGVLGALTAAGDLAVAQVELARVGTFAFGGPDRRLILAVRDGFGALDDLVAIASHNADEWALRCRGGVLLGESALMDAEGRVLRHGSGQASVHGRAALRLFGTPLAWLKGGGEGICVLDWGRGALTRLRGLGEAVTLLCDPGAGERLKAMLLHGGLPRVSEAGDAVRRAA